MRKQFITVGTEVEAGIGEDRDYGQIVDADGDLPVVAWKGSESRTPCALADIAPWAAEIVKVDGGFMAFESVADYDTWKAQA